jgi:hypothetical protein
MAATTFRFIHASDFHLEQTPIGLDTVPDLWRERLIDAPYRAADRVFFLAALRLFPEGSLRQAHPNAFSRGGSGPCDTLRPL